MITIETPKSTEILIQNALSAFTREKLREAARVHNIKRGRDKADTIQNIIDSENKSVLFYLVGEGNRREN